MATTGFRLAANIAQIVNTSLTISNLTNALVENDSVASGSTTTKNATATIEFTNFGFDALIPSDATVDQVNLRIRGSATSGASVQACLLRRSTTDGSELGIGTFNASLQTATSTAYARPGGGSWARADLLDGTLAARARSLQPNNTTSRTYAWAYVEVEVVYTPAVKSGDGTAALTLAASGVGASVMSGLGTIALTLALVGAGALTANGFGVAALTLSTTGVGEAPADSVPEGSGAAALTLAASGAGETVTSGGGSAALSLSATGEGDSPVLAIPEGSGSASVVLGATGVGTELASGSGEAHLGLGIGPTRHFLSLLLSTSTQATGVGEAPAVGVQDGFGVATLTLGASGAGTSLRSGSGQLSLSLGVQGSGEATQGPITPDVLVLSGVSATGSFAGVDPQRGTLAGVDS